jgi:DNA-binding GntR family transcriptional regulator
LTPTLVKDKVAAIIVDAIFAGKINPGEQINELGLARQLGVGTTSIRESLFELERRGFIRRIPNKGSYVTRYSEEDIAEIYAVRRELEGLAVELVVANRIEEADRKRLRQIIRDMETAARQTNLTRFYGSDLEFHKTLWLLSQNRFISQLLESITIPLFAFYVMRTKQNSGELLAGARAHKGIVDAIESGDPARAREVMENSMMFFLEHGHVLRKQAAR